MTDVRRVFGQLYLTILLYFRRSSVRAFLSNWLTLSIHIPRPGFIDSEPFHLGFSSGDSAFLFTYDLLLYVLFWLFMFYHFGTQSFLDIGIFSRILGGQYQQVQKRNRLFIIFCIYWPNFVFLGKMDLNLVRIPPAVKRRND